MAAMAHSVFMQAKGDDFWHHTKSVRVFLSTDMLRSGTNPIIALQPINPMGELGYFHHPKQRNKEQKLTWGRTVEWCDGNKNTVVLKAKKVNSTRYDKNRDWQNRLIILSLWYVGMARTKNRQLLLLCTRVVRGQVNSKAPSVSECWNNLK